MNVVQYYCGERRVFRSGSSLVVSLPKNLIRGISSFEVTYDPEAKVFTLTPVEKISGGED